MTIILCEDKCPECGGQLVKNPESTGDYYPTVRGVVLMRFCRNCGSGLPLVSEMYPEQISNIRKKRVLKHIANIKNLSYKDIISIYHQKLKYIQDRNEFIRTTAIETQIPLTTVASFV